MRQALRLAERGRGFVEPNPMVGAVLVRDGAVVAGGHHQRYGGAHAEVELLEACRHQGIEPAGATVVVSLEPCCHHGKTPPCVEALVRARIHRVVVAVADPFPAVDGKGIAALRDAGLQVEVGVLAAEARCLNEAYFKRVQTGLPWIIAKWAQTLDGKIATAGGDSQWISGAAARQVVHELRGRVDAIMVGVGTVIADDPELTARQVPVRRTAQRIVVDPHGRMPATAKLARGSAPPVRVVGQVVPALRQLAQEGATNVLVEGGATLLGSLFAEGLVDQVLAFVAPRIAGDASALDAVRGLHLPSIADSRKLVLHRTERVGQDVLLDYRVDHGRS